MTTVQYEDFALADGEYAASNGNRFKVWTQSDGQWACVARDHGPLCRRCQKLDEVAACCIAVVIEGHLDVFDDPDRGMVFRINEAGKASVETAIRRGGFDRGLDA